MTTGPAATTGTIAHVLKGHGTENDFVIVPDLDGGLDLDVATVRALCDRRAGIGADGVLRVVRTRALDDAPVDARDTEFFMDYRNADGSVAEMCGNGLRVFLRYLDDQGLIGPGEQRIGTRAGALRAALTAEGEVTVDLGVPQRLVEAPYAQAEPMDGPRVSRAVLMPNPHVVIELDSSAQLTSLDLTRAPIIEPALPQGQNVEFVTTVDDHHLRLRVHERGVGETRSCGTGIGAVVAVRAEPGDPQPWRVDVPGGTCTVRWDADGHLWLTGPAVIVARIDFDPRWLGAHTPAAISAGVSG